MATENTPTMQLIIRPQTPQEEFEYLLYVLKRASSYKENGCTFELPGDLRFQQLTSETPTLFPIFEKEVYDQIFFQKGIQALESQREVIQQVFPVFHKWHDSWGFRFFPQYSTTLTRYGPGGSYLEDEGRIIMMTRADGSFKRSSPRHTVIHEMVHLGIEEAVVKRFGLTQMEKERLVDKICSTQFADLLRDYQLQSKGDSRIDSYVTKETLENLPKAVGKYISAFPRK